MPFLQHRNEATSTERAGGLLVQDFTVSNIPIDKCQPDTSFAFKLYSSHRQHSVLSLLQFVDASLLARRTSGMSAHDSNSIKCKGRARSHLPLPTYAEEQPPNKHSRCANRTGLLGQNDQTQHLSNLIACLFIGNH